MSVFHLKYRPQKISELDLPEVSTLLTKILKMKERPQSFLLSGPKGSGKTSTARIMAKAVNCLELDGVEPCGKCKNCLEITKGNSMDVIEVDGASNRGIEDVRSLKEGAYLSPSRLKVKVFIIDEVHMLTKEAFNALLKLIEEPPQNTMFLLCTTDPEKIPETVLSRLTKLDFRKGNKAELYNSIKKTVDKEKLEIEGEALDIIAERSDGSFRNIQKTLNDLVMNYGKKMTKGQVAIYFEERSGDYDEGDFEQDLAAGETRKILEKLEKMANKAVDFRSFRERLVVYFQSKLLMIYGVGEGMVVMSRDDLVRWLNLLIQASKVEKEAVIAQLPLELAVVEFGKTNPKIENLKPKEEPKIELEEKKQETRNVKLDDNFKISVSEIESSWSQVLGTIKPFNHSVEAFLRASRPMKTEGRTVTFEVFYPFHKERLEEARNRKIVEMGLEKVFGAELVFECVLSKGKKPVVINNDTPANVSQGPKLPEDKKDIYEVAKEIFG